MANWTVATTLERLGEILNEELILDEPILDSGTDLTDSITLTNVIDVMKERIVRDQFTPKAKAQHRQKTEAKTTGDQT